MKMPSFLRKPEDEKSEGAPQDPEVFSPVEEQSESAAGAVEEESVPEESAASISEEVIEDLNPVSQSVEGVPLVEEFLEPEPAVVMPEPVTGGEMPSPSLPPTEELPVQPPKPGWFKRFLKWLFNKETKFGRFMRHLALWVGIFGLGILFSYIFLVRPRIQQVSMLNTNNQQTAAQLTESNQSLQSVEQELDSTKQDLAVTQSDLELASARFHLAKVSQYAVEAQLALANGQKVNAAEAINEAESELLSVRDYIAQDSPDVAQQMQDRLEAARSSITLDSKQAAADLNTLLILVEQQDRILSTP